MNIVVKFAEYGLIHCDFNEFNIMLKDDGTPVIIDFPQMISTSHANAEWSVNILIIFLTAVIRGVLAVCVCRYFNKDVECVREFFKKRFAYEGEFIPVLEDVVLV